MSEPLSYGFFFLVTVQILAIKFANTMEILACHSERKRYLLLCFISCAKLGTVWYRVLLFVPFCLQSFKAITSQLLPNLYYLPMIPVSFQVLSNTYLNIITANYNIFSACVECMGVLSVLCILCAPVCMCTYIYNLCSGQKSSLVIIFHSLPCCFSGRVSS